MKRSFQVLILLIIVNFLRLLFVFCSWKLVICVLVFAYHIVFEVYEFPNVPRSKGTKTWSVYIDLIWLQLDEFLLGFFLEPMVVHLHPLLIGIANIYLSSRDANDRTTDKI